MWALTSVSLDTSCYFAGTDVVEVGDILAKNSLEVAFTETLRVDFTSVDPYDHVRVRAHEHTNTCEHCRCKQMRKDVLFGRDVPM